MNFKDYIKINVPAKTFFIGEYSVLRGKSALVLTHGPVFVFEFYKKRKGVIDFHPDSLAGRLLSNHKDSIKDCVVKISDPYKSIGGVGFSSAEYIASWMFVDHVLNDESPVILSFLMEDFFELTRHEKIKPSGVDVIAQCQPKPFNKINSSKMIFKSIEWPFDDYGVVLFHTLNHCYTHCHLKTLKKIPDELLVASEKSIISLETNDLEKMIFYIKMFVEIQDKVGLLSAKTKKNIDLLESQQGVLVAKGCGAMGEDVIAVVVDKRNIEDINKYGQMIGLTTLVRDFDFNNQIRVKKHFNVD